MAEINSILDNAADIGLSPGSTEAQRRVADIRKGGQLGLGLNAQMLDAATPLAFTPTVIVVVDTPKMYMRKSAIGQMIKAVMETHAKSVSGIDLQYTLNTEEAPAGHDGQLPKMPTNTIRAGVDPVFSFNELTGNIIWDLFTTWIFDINHPDTNGSMQYAAYTDDRPPAWTVSSYSAKFMAIQFDQTMHPDNIIEAAFFTNVYPTDAGPVGFERTVGTTKLVEREVTFSAVIQHNDEIRRLAVDMAKNLRLANARYVNTGDGDALLKRTAGVTGVADDLAASGLQQEADSVLGG